MSQNNAILPLYSTDAAEGATKAIYTGYTSELREAIGKGTLITCSSLSLCMSMSSQLHLRRRENTSNTPTVFSINSKTSPVRHLTKEHLGYRFKQLLTTCRVLSLEAVKFEDSLQCLASFSSWATCQYDFIILKTLFKSGNIGTPPLWMGWASSWLGPWASLVESPCDRGAADWKLVLELPRSTHCHPVSCIKQRGEKKHQNYPTCSLVRTLTHTASLGRCSGLAVAQL